MLKSFTLTLVLCLSIIGSVFSQKENMDTLSYSVGVLIAQNLKQQGLAEVNADKVAEGLADVLANKELKISVEEASMNMQTYMQGQQEKIHGAAIEEGKKFLEENGKRDGVVTLPSGLQYEIMQEGKGPKPAPTDNVTTHYHGTLINGTVFDSSVQRNEPASFPVNGVIMGWQEALQLMPQGSKWKLFVPYNLAYGERGAGQTIGPFATLVFEVELISIN